MVIRRGNVCWVDLGDPLGSEPAYRRPVVVVQHDEFNASKLATVIVLPLISNLELRKLPGCVLLTAGETGLPRDSVVNASQIRTIDRARIDGVVGQLDDALMAMIDETLKRVLGLH